MQYTLFPSDPFMFFSLGSGSSGNCYYLGNSEYGVLIDAGVGVRTIIKRLKEYDISMHQIQAILITHEHFDHVKSATSLAHKHFLPVYATREVHKRIEQNTIIPYSLNGSRKYIKKESAFHIRDIRVTPFEVPHDSVDNVGYFFEIGDQTFALATDVGIITDTISHYICASNHLVIESNYDEDLLQNGRYPYHLKKRITSGTGHLSNLQTSHFLSENYSDKLKNIWLCHLSGDNNTPELAFKATQEKFAQKGITVGEDVNLQILGRNQLSPKTIL
ncbi:MAG: MBL fold metallo-hydrolase [Dysgonamonadaceae bacterium]|jgi:phosphoribosyl 1,2-cyclic phosphodiesterase|nr:MBL fold metallo-hydrolase [Dysgonamonadaceae bacterium]